MAMKKCHGNGTIQSGIGPFLARTGTMKKGWKSERGEHSYNIEYVGENVKFGPAWLSHGFEPRQRDASKNNEHHTISKLTFDIQLVVSYLDCSNLKQKGKVKVKHSLIIQTLREKRAAGLLLISEYTAIAGYS